MAPKRGRGGGARRLLVPEVKMPSFGEVDLHGPRPEAPDQLFLVQGSGTHRVRKEQIVSMRLTDVEEVAERLRSAGGRLPLIINAGTPTETNPEAGKCFRVHEFVPKRQEVNESEWRSQGNGAPLPLHLHVSDHQYCSSADVLARYAGGEALAPSGHALFIVVFLNEGNPKFLPKPTELSNEEERQAFSTQRMKIGRNLSKLFLVYADCAKSALQCKDRGSAMIACLTSIVSDKSPGSPGASYQSSIAGYHDRSRLHVLPLGHVRRMQALVAHYDLESWFPALTPSWPIKEWMPLAYHRTRAVDALGAPENGLVTPDWLEKRGSIPFDTPWVQQCDMAHPSGKHDGCGKPVLVPLAQGSAEERNGVPWLRLDVEDAASEHYQQISRALERISGGTERKRNCEQGKSAKEQPEKSKEMDEVARLRVENAKLGRKVDSVKSELAAAQHHVTSLIIECQKQETLNQELTAALRARDRDGSA